MKYFLGKDGLEVVSDTDGDMVVDFSADICCPSLVLTSMAGSFFDQPQRNMKVPHAEHETVARATFI